MNIEFEYKDLLTEGDLNAGFTTIGFCLALTDSIVLPEETSMKGIRSALDVKYSHEEWNDYKPIGCSVIGDLFGMNLEFLTPLLLTQRYSPFYEAVKHFDAPHDLRLRSELIRVCYAALWQLSKVTTKDSYRLADQQDPLGKLLWDAHAIAVKRLMNLVIFAVPGWSYEACLNYRFATATRSKMLKEGMIVTDRICKL